MKLIAVYSIAVHLYISDVHWLKGKSGDGGSVGPRFRFAPWPCCRLALTFRMKLYYCHFLKCSLPIITNLSVYSLPESEI